MKITRKQLKNTLSTLKAVDNKEQIVSLQIENGVLNIYSRNDSMLLKLKNIKTDEKDTELMTIKREFLFKIEKQNPEDFELKFNRKTLSSKVNGISFTTAILDEALNSNIQEEETSNCVMVTITPEIMKSLNEALLFADSDIKRPILQGINLVLEKGILTIVGTDSIKLYTNQIDTKLEGEFNITMRPNTINLLNSVFEANEQKNFPILVNDKAIYISSKGMFFKSVILEGTYPKIKFILDKTKAKETLLTGVFDEELIKKIKAIENKTKDLRIEKAEGEITFIMRSDINENSFKIQSEGQGSFVKNVNYSDLLLIATILNEFKIKEDCIVLEKDNKTLLLMLLREQ